MAKTIHILTKEHDMKKELYSLFYNIRDDIQDPVLKACLAKKPSIIFKDMAGHLGTYSHSLVEITLATDFVKNYSWFDVVDVFRHEMAHMATDFMKEIVGTTETSHGDLFNMVCKKLSADPAARTAYVPLSERIETDVNDGYDSIKAKVEKLFSLATSSNKNEADAAMFKAHQIMEKYNVDEIQENQDRGFNSIYLGDVLLKRKRADRKLYALLQDFYFVKCIWVQAYDFNKGKRGLIIEASGTKSNLKIAQYVFYFIKNFIDREWKKYRASDDYFPGDRKDHFADGIVRGFYDKLEDQRDQAQEEIDPGTRSLVVTEDTLLNEYYSTRHPHIVNSSATGFINRSQSYYEGLDKGKSLTINKGVEDTQGNNGLRLIA